MEDERVQLIHQESQPKRLMVIFGYVFAFVGTVGFSASAGFSQTLGGSVPGFELNLWRFGTQVLLAAVFILPLRLNVCIPKDKILWLVILCLAYNGHNITFYEASIYLPVAELICINNVIPLPINFFVTMAMYKTCRLCEFLAVGLCMAGALLVTQPHVLFPTSPKLSALNPVCPKESTDILSVNSTFKEWATASTSTTDFIYASNISENISMHSTQENTDDAPVAQNELLGVFLDAASAIFLVTRVFVTNKKLQGLNPIVVAFWVALSGVTLSSILMAAFETPTVPQALPCHLLLFGHAFSASVAALMNTVGELNIPPTMFALIGTLETVMLLCSQYTVLKTVNPGRGNVLEIVGAMLVFLGNTVGPCYSFLKECGQSENTNES